MVLLLSEKGICTSMASACSANSKKISHVLKAIGLNEEESKSTIRITFGEENELPDVRYLVKTIKGIINKLQQM